MSDTMNTLSQYERDMIASMDTNTLLDYHTDAGHTYEGLARAGSSQAEFYLNMKNEARRELERRGS